jgi:serine/threonine protein kinase
MLVGRGSHADVYAVEMDGRSYALKIYKKYQKLAAREAGLLGLLKSHPNIVRLYEVDADSMLMELCQTTLYNIIVGGTMWKYDVVRLMREMMTGVAYMHANGMAHFDLKPENVLLTGMGTVRLCDFGLSICGMEYGMRDVRARSELLNPMCCGSNFYRAPEVLLGLPYGYSADVWALGCVLAEMIKQDTIFDVKNENITHQLEMIWDVLGCPRWDWVEARLSPSWKVEWEMRDNDCLPLYIVMSKRAHYYSLVTARCGDKMQWVLNAVIRCLTINPDERITMQELLTLQ